MHLCCDAESALKAPERNKPAMGIKKGERKKKGETLTEISQRGQTGVLMEDAVSKAGL